MANPATPAATNTLGTNVFRHVPKRHFSTLQKLNPIFWFGNADDPKPPDSYRSNLCCRVFYWYCRNSFHNFTFYVIGIADHEFVRVGRFPQSVFSPNNGWNWAVSRFGFLRLPFVSYRHGGFKCYIGWRNGGNFGLKLNLRSRD